jgi:hypothetical protein
MRSIRGNSTIPCPNDMRSPALLSLLAFAMVTANKGPGDMTPDSDIATTESINK